MSWFKRHLNWTWLFFYILTLIVAYSLVVYMALQPPPMMVSPELSGHFEPRPPIQLYTFDSHGNQIKGDLMNLPDKWIDDPPKYIVDKNAVEALNFTVAIFWFWPLYLIGTICTSRWVLKQKNRSFYWLWLTVLLFPITPLILATKPTESESAKSIAV